MWTSSISSTVAFSGRLTVLEIAPDRNGWTAAIIRTWPIGRDRPRAHGGVEDLVVLGLEAGGVDDVALVGDVLDDRLDGLAGVAELLAAPAGW